MEDFRDYLEAVCQAPRLWGTCGTYVETEVTDRQRLSSPEEEFDPFGGFLDLMVQNVVLEEKPAPEGKPEREEKPKEKIERLPVLTGICKYAAGHVLLVGRPGSGKTTALERLLVRSAETAREDSTTLIPVLIRLRDLHDSTVLERMRLELEQGLSLELDEIKKLLRSGRFLVLLDGVNELPSDKMRREVENFRQEYQRTTPMIFTTRELNVGLDLGIEKKLEMQPLNEEQIREFTRRHLGQEQGQQLIKGLGQRLREFGEIPLFLSMLCVTYKKNGEIPANLGGVFRGFAGTYDNFKKFDGKTRTWYGKFLQRLAFMMMPQGNPQGLRLTISNATAEGIFIEFLKENNETDVLSKAGETLDKLLKFHLLRPKNNQELEFIHQLFQEYYAGEYLLSLLQSRPPKLGDLELQKCYLNYLDWTEAIALMAGLVGDRSQAVRLVSLGLKVDLMLGARLAGEVLPQFQEETVGLVTKLDLPLWLKVELWGKTKCDQAVDFLILALQDEDEVVHQKAAEALLHNGSDKTINALIRTLQDQDPDVCRRALYTLGRINSNRTVDVLIEILLQDHDWHLSYAAAFFLSHIGSDKAVDALIKTFQDQPQTRHGSGIVVETLGKIGSDKAIDILILALQDYNVYIRENAVVALGRIGSDKAVDALVKVLQDQERNVRLGAAEALGNIGSDKAVDALVKALQDQERNVRLGAAEALGNIGSDKAVDALIKALQDKDVYLDNVAEALGKIGSDKAVDALIKDLRDKDSYIYRKAAEALSEIGSDRAIDALIKALQDQNENVRQSVAEALGKIDSDKAVDALIKTLQDQDENVRQSAAWALGNISSKQAVDALILALQDKDSDVRENAAEALGKIGSYRAVDALIEALQKDSDVRENATEALENLGNVISEWAVNALIEIIQKDSYVRKNAAEALGKIGSDKAVDALILALQDHNWNIPIRRNAAEALGKIGSDKATDALILALQDRDSDVRRNAAEALGKIGSDKATDALILVLQDKESGLYWRAAEALGKIGSDKLISQLWQICRSDIIDYALDAISKIQERYKLYNYEISQTPLPIIAPTPNSVTYNIDQVGQMIQTLNVDGNNTGIQNL